MHYWQGVDKYRHPLLSYLLLSLYLAPWFPEYLYRKCWFLLLYSFQRESFPPSIKTLRGTLNEHSQLSGPSDPLRIMSFSQTGKPEEVLYPEVILLLKWCPARKKKEKGEKSKEAMFSFISNVRITHHIDLTSGHLHLSAGRAGPRQQLRGPRKGQPQMTTLLLLADSCSGTRDEQLSLGRWNRSVSRKWIQSRVQRDTKWHFMHKPYLPVS